MCCFSDGHAVDVWQTCLDNLTLIGMNKSQKKMKIMSHGLFSIRLLMWHNVTLVFGEWFPLEYTFSQLTLVLTQVKCTQIPEANISVCACVCVDRESIPKASQQHSRLVWSAALSVLQLRAQQGNSELSAPTVTEEWGRGKDMHIWHVHTAKLYIFIIINAEADRQTQDT